MSDARVNPHVLFDAATIAKRVGKLAEEIASSCPKHIAAVVTLTGGFVFAADLLRALSLRGVTAETDVIRLSSYGRGTTSLGEVRLVTDIEMDIHDRFVLIIDDILDTGRTLAFASHHLMQRGASSVRSCVLLDKPSQRVVNVTPDFVGFAIPNQFVVGYGLDMAGQYRELPFVGVMPGG
jgi:hypoxanthine phosphoribosyltransferase